MAQIELRFEGQIFPKDPGEHLPQGNVWVSLNCLQVDDRLFYHYLSGSRGEKYGTVLEIIEPGRFFKVGDLGREVIIQASQIVPGSIHRWIKKLEDK